MYKLDNNQMYHMPHNTAIADELIFLLNNIDLKKKFYTFQEITKMLFIEEVKQDKFKIYHPRPYANLININKKLYSNFKNNPELYYENIMSIQYSTTKTWRQNWVEFVRDYVDFAAYCGLMPCYYKTPGTRASQFDGYIVTDQLIKFRNAEINFERVLMDYKYSNTSINIERFSQFNIKVRPFYLGLQILSKLNEKGINKLERRLFFASIVCSKDENIEEIVTYLENWIKTKGNVLNNNNSSETFSKEAGRVATGMQDFFLQYKLIERSIEGRCHFFSITSLGLEVLKEIPPNAMYFGNVDSNTGLLYSPLVANLLQNFAANVMNKNTIINKTDVEESLSKIAKDTLYECINYLKEIKPSPIKEINNTSVILNEFANQYHVVANNDFADLNDINFVNNSEIKVSLTSYSYDKIELPDQNILNELENAALSSEGSRYEKALNNALSLLPGCINYFGANTTGERYSDLVWKIDMPSTEGNKTYLVIFEVKSGSAIKSFDERKVIPQIQNTINQYRDDFKKVEGIWYIILDSDQLPRENKHGGARKNTTQRTLSQKLFIIQQSITSLTGRSSIVTAFGIYPFLEYYKYLYSMSRHTLKENNISNMYIKQFFNTGEVFTNYYSSYSGILNDSSDINNFLVYGK